MSERIPERLAAEKIGQLVGRYLQPPVLTEACLTQIGGKLVASRAVVRDIFDQLDASPGRIGERDVVLRQQSTHDLEDVEFWAEHVHHLKREYEDALAIFERVSAADRTARQDVRASDEDDERLSQERADAFHADAAPRWAS